MKRRRKNMEQEKVINEVKENARLAPPWINFANELIVLFGQDKDIKTEYNEEENVFTMFVDGEIKADAIAKLIPSEKKFGNVTMKINVVPSDNVESKEMLFRNAFANNPVFSYAKTIEGVFSNPITYIVWKKLIVQYYNDDISDINGNRTTLLHEIAKDVFDEDGVYYCVDNSDNK